MLNSTVGGRRFIRFKVVHRPRWWRRRSWVVLMDYTCDTFVDHDVPTSHHHTLTEANSAASAAWLEVVADHEHAERLSVRSQA